MQLKNNPANPTETSSHLAHPKYRPDIDPGGHFKFPHLWPGQIPPGRTTGKAGLLLGMGTLGKAAGGFLEAIALAAKLDQHAAVQ